MGTRRSALPFVASAAAGPASWYSASLFTVSKKNQRHCLIDEKNLKTEFGCQLGRTDEEVAIERVFSAKNAAVQSGNCGSALLAIYSDLGPVFVVDAIPRPLSPRAKP